MMVKIKNGRHEIQDKLKINKIIGRDWVKNIKSVM